MFFNNKKEQRYTDVSITVYFGVLHEMKHRSDVHVKSVLYSGRKYYCNNLSVTLFVKSVAPPTVVGAWSMVALLWQLFE